MAHKVSGELATAGLIAVFLAYLAMPVSSGARRVAVRSERLPDARVGRPPDPGVFALPALNFSLTLIAALFTLGGNTENDKLVDCVRIREKLGSLRKQALRE